MSLFQIQNTKRLISAIDSSIHTRKIKEKIIVIESDDWGAIRMPSLETYNQLLSNGIRVDLNPYEKLDSILTEIDLLELFGVLESFKDNKNNHPVITANAVVANPDFNLIKESDFQKYHRESILSTLDSYGDKLWDKWMYGSQKGILKFQYHAREHVNVSLWMKSLQLDKDSSRFFFQNHLVGGLNFNQRWYNPFVTATHFLNQQDKVNKINNYAAGLDEFEDIFGFKSKTVIPTNYLWDSTFNYILRERGVEGLQGSKVLIDPLSRTKAAKRYNFKINNGLMDIVRNCSFEPALSVNKRNELEMLKRNVNILLKLNLPIIISMHRINFSGRLFSNNRDENLLLLYDFFSWVIKKWPEIEFKSSDELLGYMN